MENKLSVILPVLIYERYLLNMTRACIENLRFFTQPYEVELILVHNKWKLYDNVKEYLKKDDIYIANEKNERLGKCLNQGIAKASSDYLCILANDVMVHQDWYKYAKETIDNGSFDFVIPWMERYLPEEKSLLRGFSFSDGAGNCCVFKKKTYDLVGPFDENLFVYCDRDYKIRIEEKGLRVGTHLKSFATHLGSMTWLGRHESVKNEQYLGFNFWDADNYDNDYFEKKWGHKT